MCPMTHAEQLSGCLHPRYWFVCAEHRRGPWKSALCGLFSSYFSVNPEKNIRKVIKTANLQL